VKALTLAADILREAVSRKWFLALGVGITLVLGITFATLRLDVVDGALAATRLFGKAMSSPITAVDVALRPLFRAVAYWVFYGGLTFGIVSCADFAPRLFSPGRIEQLLALPVRRWELLLGTYLGVLLMALLGTLYGTGGLILLIGVKAGHWTVAPLVAGLLAVVGFAAVYGAMLAAAVFARSAALSAGVGGLVFLLGVIAGFRQKIAPMIEAGVARSTFEAISAALPRLSSLATASADLAASEPLGVASLGTLALGTAFFGGFALVLAAWRFEGKDY
jgi:Cu-processing system permease protein